MATVTGDVAYDFSAEPNANPWSLADGSPGDPFVTRQGTPIIDSNALKSNFNAACFVAYAESLPDQAAFEVKGESVNGSDEFRSTIGCGGLNADGNGYISWVYGTTWRIYRVDAFALTQLGGGESISRDPLDAIGLRYEFSGGTATLTATLEGSDTTLVRTDSTSPHNGDLEACWFFGFQNSNADGFRSIAVDGITTGPQLVNINDDDIIEIGSVGNTLNTADLDVGFLSIGGIEVGLSEVTPDQHTFVQPWFTDFETYPPLGTIQALAATGSDPEAPDYESATKNVTLQLPADWSGITYVTLSDDPDSLASMIEGATIETGDIHYYRPADITLYDDSTFSDAPSGTVETWLRKSATNLMIQVLIINGVPVVPGGNWAPIEFIEKIDFIG